MSKIITTNLPELPKDDDQAVAFAAKMLVDNFAGFHLTARVFAELDDRMEDFVDRICAFDTRLRDAFIHKVIDCGRGRLHPELLLPDGPGVECLRRLPYEMQEKYLMENVSVVTKEGDSTKVILMDVRNLLPTQARQVFAKDRIRTEAEQRAYLEAALTAKANPAIKPNVDYEIVGSGNRRKVKTYVPLELDLPQVLRLVEKLTC